MVALRTVTAEDEVRILYLGPKLEDYAMTVAELWFYRGDALRLDSRKQFYGVCVKPIEILRISSANKQKFQFWFEKQNDPD